jgi:hypothetical protein
MVKESACISWDGISVHCPEHPFSLELREKIGYLSPGWMVKQKSDDNILLRNNDLDISLASDYKGSKALCENEYGRNLNALMSVGYMIRAVGAYYGVTDMESRIKEKNCEFRLTCDKVPAKVEGISQMKYAKSIPNAKAFNRLGKGSRPMVSLQEGMPTIRWLASYDKILEKYRLIPKVFKF